MADNATLVTKIYRAMGGVDTSILPKDIVNSFLEDWQVVYPDGDCYPLYHTVISCYEWLIRGSAVDNSGGGKRREKNRNREIELDAYDKSSDWSNALSSFLNAPWEAFPACKATLSGEDNENSLGLVYVGGIDNTRIEARNKDRNIRTGGASEIRGIIQPTGNTIPPFFPKRDTGEDDE